MEPTSASESLSVSPQGVLGEPSRLEQMKTSVTSTLGKVGRRLKRIEVREAIVENPLKAIGIAALAGAVVSFVRPRPQRGRVADAAVAVLGAIGLRLVRDTALQQLGEVAKNYLESAGIISKPGPTITEATVAGATAGAAPAGRS